MKRHMHLNLFIHSRGHHEASWRHPAASPLSLSDIRYYQALAQQAEAGLFDSIFLADQLALGDDIAHGPRTALEPLTVLAALAVSTSRIGLIATAGTGSVCCRSIRDLHLSSFGDQEYLLEGEALLQHS
jgi:alkanesulfonate monooxygenase SsuD/methylene tetrahydromethanopterin reductase-like flavin-dependent oxidoreductase (luciferase family)